MDFFFRSHIYFVFCGWGNKYIKFLLQTKPEGYSGEYVPKVLTVPAKRIKVCTKGPMFLQYV